MADIVIIGGGISGLATAIALRQFAGEKASGRIAVFERSSAPREVGAGLQIGPNAVKALAHLGVAALGPAGASTPKGLRIMESRSGRCIAQAPLGEWIEQRHGAPYHTMSRIDLLTVLLKAAQGLDIDIVHGSGLEELRRHGAGFVVTLASGEEVETPALIGADGLWSTVRRKLRPATKPRFTGQTAWRSLLPMEAVPEPIGRDMVTLWLAPGLHAVHYPVEQGRRLNFALFTEGATDAIGWDIAGDKNELAGRLDASGSDLAEPLAALLAAAEDFIKWPMFGLTPSIALGTGPATLVGDAAHPMLPYLAQGAAMGIEDAVVLAAKIAEMPDMEGALRAYERARARRVMRVQRGARANARRFHFSGSAALARNAILGLGERLAPGALLRRHDWLYGGGPVS